MVAQHVKHDDEVSLYISRDRIQSTQQGVVQAAIVNAQAGELGRVYLLGWKAIAYPFAPRLVVAPEHLKPSSIQNV
tara:strand:- start:263 stop:490 length:228 start_codon:yes stop_codon:yes gene_type:complete